LCAFGISKLTKTCTRNKINVHAACYIVIVFILLNILIKKIEVKGRILQIAGQLARERAFIKTCITSPGNPAKSAPIFLSQP
jgi:hypothetical protein